jgi:hypothetical protein
MGLLGLRATATMSEFIKQKLLRLGCFTGIALLVIAATGLAKVVLGWFHHDEGKKQALGNSVGEYVGKGLLGFVLVVGLITWGREIAAKLRAKGIMHEPHRETPVRRDVRELTGDQRNDENEET